MFINGRRKVEITTLKNPKTFIDYLQTIDDDYENLEDYDPWKKRRVLIEFDDMITDTESNKKLGPLVTDVFLRGKKFNIYLVFVSQSYFKVTKIIRLNAKYYFIMKIQQIASNHLSGIDFKKYHETL